MNDSEVVEQLRQWTRKIEQECRACKHTRLHHSYLGGKCRSLVGDDTLFSCDCQEFVPSDNLDYVEWLAKKKGLVQ